MVNWEKCHNTKCGLDLFKDLKVFNKSLICKLDLDSACDHVNNKFLDFSMLQMGFGVGWRGWRKWVIFCISSVRLVNVNTCSLFGSSRGCDKGIRYHYCFLSW